MPKKILIIAGEASGDLYGAHLAGAIKEQCPEAVFSGVGGTKMREAGVNIVYPIGELAIIGVSELFSKLGKIKQLFSLLEDKIDKERFDIAILVNYPGFNLRFAKSLKKRNIPVVFYSSPQVWAWGQWRVRDIKNSVDKMIVFFKFEEDFYRRCGVTAEFVGHPLVDIVSSERKKGKERTIALVPGSRKSEVKNMFPAIAGAAGLIHRWDKNTRFLVARHPELPLELYKNALQKHGLPLEIITGKTYDCLKLSDLAIVVSGSVTLEAAILNTPMIIVNRVSAFTGLLFLIFARIKNVGLVNIIAQKRLMPELLQYRATAPNIAKEAISILSDSHRYEKMKSGLKKVNDMIGPPGASYRAAKSIMRFLK